MGFRTSFDREGNVSEGSRLLWLAMSRADVTQDSLRSDLDLAQGVLSRWLRGKGKPNASFRVKLLKRFSIPIEAWDQKPTKPMPKASAA